MSGIGDKRQIPFGFLEMNRDLAAPQSQPEPVRLRHRKFRIPNGITTAELFEEAVKPEHLEAFKKMMQDRDQYLVNQLALRTDIDVVSLVTDVASDEIADEVGRDLLKKVQEVARENPGPLLEEAHRLMMEDIDEGTHCPCCGRHNQRYPNSISDQTAASLCWLVTHHCKGRSNNEWYEGIEYVDIANTAPRFVLKDRKISKLAYWGLTEQAVKDPKNKKMKTSGRWKATRAGFDFANGILRVHETLLVLNGVVQSRSEETVDVRMALRNTFDYEKLMRGGG